jgi:hypothetical protein
MLGKMRLAANSLLGDNLVSFSAVEFSESVMPRKSLSFPLSNTMRKLHPAQRCLFVKLSF